MKPFPKKKKLVSDYVGIHWTKNGCTSQINFPNVRGETKQNKSWKHHQEPSHVFFCWIDQFTTLTIGRGWRIIHVGDVSLILQQEDGLTKSRMIWKDTLEVRFGWAPEAMEIIFSALICGIQLEITRPTIGKCLGFRMCKIFFKKKICCKKMGRKVIFSPSRWPW